MTQKEYIGFDSILCIKEVLAELKSKKIFLVTGHRSYAASGAKAHFDRLEKSYELCQFSEFAVNPRIEDVVRGIDVFRSAGGDTIIAVGGGSVIDMAKAINYLSVYPSTLNGYRLQVGEPDAVIRPVIAVPTTAGSGSEATSFAVVYTGRRKHSLADESILPSAAIVDAGLTMSLPKHVTAVSGLDAFSQAVESFWSIHSTIESKRFASAAIKLIITNLAAAVNNPTADSRIKMSNAAHLAGKAINITRTTAAHSISYPMTSYFGIDHGQAVGITLSSLLVFNANVTDSDVLDKRGPEYVRRTIGEICRLLGTENPDDARQKIDELIQRIGLQKRLSELGLQSPDDIETIIANGFDPDRVKNNPRRLTKSALRGILEEIY